MWVILAGVLGGLLLLVRAMPSPGERQRSFLLGLDSASVVGLRVQRENGESDELSRGADGLWVLDRARNGEPANRWPAAESRVRGGVRLLASAEFGVRDEQPGELSGDPIGSLSVGLRGGVEKQIVFEGRGVGGRVPVSIRSGEDERRGWADRGLRETYLGRGAGSGLASWRDTAFGAGAKTADRFMIEALGERVSLRRMGGRWMLQEPVLIEADEAVVGAVLAALGEMTLERFLDHADPTDTAYGLTEPRGLIELGWPARGASTPASTRRLTLGSLTDAAGEVLHASAEWVAGEHGFTPQIVTVRVPEFPVSADSYFRKIAGSLSTTDVRGVMVRRRSDNAVASALTRSIDGWTLDNEPDRDEIGAALTALVCDRVADAAELIDGEGIDSMPGYLGEFGLIAGGGVEAEVFHVALPTTDTPRLRLIGKQLNGGDGLVHAMWSYAGPDADRLVAWFVEQFGM
ncbi:MAG: hypothetical protein ACI89L_000046 [Phycisphaerales bacterium]|jgi:hypothetical protein